MSPDFIIHINKTEEKPKKAEKEWPDNPEQGHHKKLFSFLILLAILICAGAFFYFSQLSPSFVPKPTIEKPVMVQSTEEFQVQEEQISYLMSSIGAYKLQKIPFSSNYPEMEVLITDSDEVFTVKVMDNQVTTTIGEADNPDLRITGDKQTVYDILKSDSMKDALLVKYRKGLIQIDLLKNDKELMLKGYKAIYDALNG